MGGSVIGQELEQLGYKTRRGKTRWVESTVLGIIKNEKYKGDILQGKTFTLDPISKRRLDNFGEADQFYIRNHHEPIISEDVFEAAQQILQRRSVSRKSADGKRLKYSRKYAFSSLLQCGFCESNLSRRSWHGGSKYHTVIWQCMTNTKSGKKFCPDSKGIPEEIIEKAFLESYKVLCHNNGDVMDELLQRVEESLCSGDSQKEVARLEKEILSITQKRKKLVDMHLDGIIDKETYEAKYGDLSTKLSRLSDESVELQSIASRENNVKQRIADFRSVLEKNEVLTEFDRYVFESIIDKVIVGGIDDDGDKNPAMLTFLYKTGFINGIDGKAHKPKRRNTKDKSELCTNPTNEVTNFHSHNSDPTCGGYSVTMPQ